MKTIILLTLLTSLFALHISCNSPKSSNQMEDLSTQSETGFVSNSPTWQSTKYYESLMEHFSANWKVEEPSPSDYPEYFGGAFIDNDGGFVVCIVGDEDTYRVEIADIIGSDNFKTESCRYSYREMMEVMDLIDDFLSSSSVAEDHIVIQNFAGAMADVLENRVVVNMIDVTPEIINSFRQDVSSSEVVFIQQGDLPEF